MPAGKWGVSKWGAPTTWAGTYWPPGAGWRESWRWWYQYGTQASSGWDLTRMVVEADWTTDAYTMGDGTFRGDLQPGRLQVRIFDRTGMLTGLSKLGMIWATYVPTGATWCWFVDQISQRLTATGVRPDYNVVVSADTWPARLTASAYSAARPSETVNARLSSIVTRLNTDTGLALPAVAGTIAADAHVMPALVSETDGTFKGWLQQIRDAAANGYAWLEAVPGAANGIAGTLTLHYDLWDTRTARTLDPSQIVAETVWTQGLDHLVTETVFAGTSAAGVANTVTTLGGGWGVFGVQKMGPMRVWGDLAAGGAQRAAIDTTAQTILKDRGDSAETFVDTIQMVSGRRVRGGANAWQPASMVWTPRDVAQWARIAGNPVETYRVAQSHHHLDARSWNVEHTLTKYSAPAAIP